MVHYIASGPAFDGVIEGQVKARKVVVTDLNNKIDTLDITTPKIGGTAVTATASEINTPLDGANIVQARQFDFTEEGAGTYTASLSLPAGAVIHDIIVVAVAVWDAASSASLEVGINGDDPDGFYTAVDLKATDLTAGQSLSFAQEGGVGGAYFAGTNTHVTNRYSATSVDVEAVVTSVGAGTAGRTRVVFVYSVPESTAATFVSA